MSFRENLLHLRSSHNMSQEQLAMLLGVSRQSVTKWESGKSNPEMDKLLKMCDLFDCTLDELVQGDLTERTAKPAQTMPDDVAPQDVCGYDEHRIRFASRISAGVAAILVALAFTIPLDGMFGVGNLADAAMFGVLCVGIVAGLALIVPAGLEHAAFRKAHPFVQDFYTDEQRAAGRHEFTVWLVAGIAAILLGVVVGGAADGTGLQVAGEVGLLLLVAVGVWAIVRCGIRYGLMNIEDYNKDIADENSEEGKRVSRVCGVIMLVATIIALAWLFLPIAFAPNGVADINYGFGWESFFWLPWVFGGICCGIASVVIRKS